MVGVIRGRLRAVAAWARGVLLQLGKSGVSLPGCSAAAGAEVIVSMGGVVVGGNGCALSKCATLHAEVGTIVLGDNVFVGIAANIVARERIEIGSDVLIAEHVTIRDQDHAFGRGHLTRLSGFHVSPIRIGQNVWIGAKATITAGVTIGDNAVIGANSVVTHDIPANSLAVGAPARVLRSI